MDPDSGRRSRRGSTPSRRGRSASPDKDRERDRSPKRRAEDAASNGSAAAVEKVKGLCAGSDEHKEQRWKEYQARRGKWSRERWENVYYANMDKASDSRERVEAHQKTLGWGELEKTVEVDEGVYRRLDIADLTGKRAVEHKTGYICADEFILSEVDRDSLLVNDDWDITWHFEIDRSRHLCGPSAPLVSELRKAGIKITRSYIN